MFYSLWQTKSVFGFCSCNVLLAVGGTATAGTGFASERSHLPKAEVFSKFEIILWDFDSKKPLIKDDTNSSLSYDDQQWDTYLKLMLNTFIPAFMWAYHELNTIIKEDEGRIHNNQSEINAQKVFLNGQVIRSDMVELDELDTFPSDPEQRSHEGTGAQVRKDGEWLECVKTVLKDGIPNGEWSMLPTRRM